MKLINPKGKTVEFDDRKAKKILSLPAKIKQGWKEKKQNPNSLKNLKQNTKVESKPNEEKVKEIKPKAKKTTKKKTTK
jgi:hypothetical protein